MAPVIQKTYAASHRNQSLVDGEIFLAIEHAINQRVQSQLGLAIGATNNAKLSGDIWDDADRNFNNSSYSYQLRHTYIMAKAKLLAGYGAVLQPYISGGMGVGFNRARNFTITPTEFATILTPAFSAATTLAFTYRLGVGVQRTVSTHWRVGAGYEFADWGISQLDRAPRQTINNGIAQDHFYTNGIQFNISYRA